MAASDPDQQSSSQPQPPGLLRGRPLPRAVPLPSAESTPSRRPEQSGQVPPPQGPRSPQPEQQVQPRAEAGPLPQDRTVARGGEPVDLAEALAALPAPVPAADVPAIQEQEDDSQTVDVAVIAARNSPAWLTSAAVHMALMIVLALILLPNLTREQIELETVWAETLGDQLEVESFLAGSDADKVEDVVLTPDDLALVDNPFATPPEVTFVLDGVTSTSDLDSRRIGYALLGRDEGTRRALLGAYGGTETTEKAVADGLRWLARNQRKDGSWSLAGRYDDGALQYSNGAIHENRQSATAMALLAFQGRGNTHKKGEFARTVALGWRWLLEQQNADGSFSPEVIYHGHRFYTEAQCTIALCELYGMTKDEKLREPAEQAVRYCLQTQGRQGGWKYHPRARSDVSVTGWVVMALQSARMAGLEVPQDHLLRVQEFLDAVALEDGTRYPYELDREATPAMTAEALLCRQYLGWRRDDPRLLDGVDWITQPENLIDYDNTWPEKFVYYWYYATQVVHHMEGEYWQRWNEVMRQRVPAHQVKTGREAGSWDPGKPNPAAYDGYEWYDQYTPYGGRLYVTCLSIYMLEVYYRHLPIYSNVFKYVRGL